jgi:uncharacterized protein (DUF302 family)
MFLTGLITGIVLTILLIVLAAPKMMFHVTESNYDFEQTAAMIEQSTKDNQWSMPHQYDLQMTMAKHGFTVKPVKVFSICKPDIAIRILGNDTDRHIAAMMPCRVAIFEKSNGKTYVARMNAGLLSKLLGSNVKAVMGEAGQDSEKIIEPLFN